MRYSTAIPPTANHLFCPQTLRQGAEMTQPPSAWLFLRLNRGAACILSNRTLHTVISWLPYLLPTRLHDPGVECWFEQGPPDCNAQESSQSDIANRS
jgi:hypothetical protein